MVAVRQWKDRCQVFYRQVFSCCFQLFDATVVVLSLAAEIVLFLMHDSLLCYHVATEAVAFIVILRLWRIPQTCDSKYMCTEAKLVIH